MTATPGQADEPVARIVQLALCDPCIDGQGDECHTPGCALFLFAPPERSIRDFVSSGAAPAQEPQPAPGESSPLGLKHAVTSNRLGHALAALREIADPSGDEFPRDTARNALDDDAAIRDNVELTREPKPAPELAAAMAETRQLREQLAEILAFLGDGIPPGDEFAVQVAAWRERARLTT